LSVEKKKQTGAQRGHRPFITGRLIDEGGGWGGLKATQYVLVREKKRTSATSRGEKRPVEKGNQALGEK